MRGVPATYKKRIAPRLAGGGSRLPWGGRLPEPIKEGLRRIAYQERKSLSWVLEETVIRYFNLAAPEYLTRSDVTVDDRTKRKATTRAKAVA